MSLGHLHRFDPLLGDLFWVQTKVGIVYLDTTLFSFLFVIDEVDWFTFTAFGRLELKWCERKILLGWLELELVAGVV